MRMLGETCSGGAWKRGISIEANFFRNNGRILNNGKCWAVWKETGVSVSQRDTKHLCDFNLVIIVSGH